MAERKIRVAILFGGRSAEHDVSRASAANVLRSLDPDRYETTAIGITRDGRWIAADAGNGAGAGSGSLTIPDHGPQLALLPGGQGRVVVLQGSAAPAELPAFDVVFPVLHGPNGEDGTVQGALELSDVAYVGSRVMGSAAGMDKDVAKRLMREAGLPIVPFVVMSAAAPISYADAVSALGSRELFVKPANMGSSVGVSRAGNAEEFESGCRLALRFDSKILIERCVAPVREVECAVLEDAEGRVRASQLGEIVPSDKHGFYSYDAKYLDADGALLQVPADVPPAVADRIKELAIRTFGVLGCEGMARIDFFLHGEQAYVNEANTLPGFTNISMYPRLWEASGLPQPALMDVLIGHALERHKRSRGLAFERE
ncbi:MULTISPECIES: D-alanine--D-alanine ligase family protein [Bradyrhizobium]|uniref:D-alanine--D-alanine ligase family protein n=1 Tax=Bradyrhizobium TaxID=374 RepID=UPI000422A4FC|nr:MULTISPECIES: D-alanine--D-alanine ligase family protein [Bradyrhizobium]KIU43543.1 D-alanine--D-alanine ligase [Bradyrhizobium elkanii]MBK5656622.1 D-alanine--D-alanine ligase [Rhizobium sp.]OCX31302.1 D-alanine--D-alanine ligase A [Bradyrhizobium sp. UASWS1016]